MMIDFHMHMFPDRIAEKTIEKLEATAQSPAYSDGTVVGAKQFMDKAGITKGVAMHIATKPTQQQTINTWAASLQDGRLWCFGSVHPDSEDVFAELTRIKALGLKGIKLHPDYQNFYFDEERMMPIYEQCAALGLPILTHAGADPVSPGCVHGQSAMIARVAKRLPQLTIIAAHMGGMRRYDEAEAHLAGLLNVYLDTSMSTGGVISTEQMTRIIKKHGADRVLFATDCPWSDGAEEIALIDSLALTATEKEQIFYKNALRLLGE